MIPNNKNDFEEIDIEPSKTYKMGNENLNGYIDNKESVTQAIYKILNTERYKYLIYSFDYGIELLDLIGKDIEYCKLELPRRIEDCLLQDDRILKINNYRFETIDKNKLLVQFTVETIFGSVGIKKDFAF